MARNEKKKNFLILKRIYCFLGVASLVGLVGCSSNHHSKKSFTDVVAQHSDINSFDDITPEELIEEVGDLEEYLKLSEQLHSLNLDSSFVVFNDAIQLLSVEELNWMCEQSNDFEKELAVQEKLVNRKIYESYSLMEKVTSYCIKSKIIDSFQLDSSDIDSIYIPEENFNFEEPTTTLSFSDDVERNTLVFEMDSDFTKGINDVYNMQHKGESNDYIRYDSEKTYQYNKERNQLIEQALDDTKVLLSNEYVSKNLYVFNDTTLVRKK